MGLGSSRTRKWRIGDLQGWTPEPASFFEMERSCKGVYLEGLDLEGLDVNRLDQCVPLHESLRMSSVFNLNIIFFFRAPMLAP